MVCVALGCEPSAGLDAGSDAPPPEDAFVRDAPLDTRADAGCTGRPGELVGERSIDRGDLPLLSWTGLDGEVALLDHHEPCAPAGRVIVLRQLAAWSGHSLWHAAHTADVVAMDDVVVIDLWAADEDAMPMRPASLHAELARYDAPPTALASDPDEQLGALAIAGIQLPIIVVVDARTLHVERTLFDPRAGDLPHSIRVVQAHLRGEPEPRRPEPELVDGRFTLDRWDLVQQLGAPFVPPPSPSNAYADDPAAATLGEHLFEDTTLSPAGVSCRTCHQPSRAFTDGLSLGRGVEEVTRNTPTVIGASAARWQFWDGRADTLWAQAAGPFENAREMGSSRLFVAHRVADTYRADYEAIFGPLPSLEDAVRFPPAGMPGEAAWEAMSAEDRDAVTRVFVNVAKAIEAYERTIVPVPGRLEAYASGSYDALTPGERDGLQAFVSVGCTQCHWGPLLSNGAFFAVDMPGVGEGEAGDRGRIAALAPLTSSELRAQGPYSDDRSLVDPLAGLTMLPERTLGAFRTPTLRGLSQSGPYGHAGTFASLHDVTVHYAHIRMPHTRDPRVVGTLDPHLLGFEDFRIDAVTRFLELL